MSKPQNVHPPLTPLGAMLFGIALSASSYAAEDAPTRLEAVRISDVQTVRDEDLPRYQPAVTTVGKLRQLAHDVPQAVTVVTKELLHDKADVTLREALSNVAGLTFNAAEGGADRR